MKRSNLADRGGDLGDALARRSAALRAEPPSASSAAPAAVAIAGPSASFLKLTRNPDLPQPQRFEPTVKADGDVVL